ncbi:MAG TPA: lipopolysaccharide biosynthesis protein [Candidatus Parabacteroides faecavium]|nr:lipopolysaccharide biosynthesis protein [Candidatus Parabacteroides faecavium]
MEKSNPLSNARIAQNTIILYIRMILLMGVTLYTSRLVLVILGVEDYGIYNVVGGFLGMFTFLNSAMSSCTQRYITYAIGRGDEKELKKIFSASIKIHLLIAVIVFFLSETIGLWFVMTKLVIPSDRFIAAMVVYQCTIVSTLIMIMGFPFNADIIAHEKMSMFAYISAYEVLAKLLIMYLLVTIAIDKLVLYSVLLLIIQVSIITIYFFYCRRYFVETKAIYNVVDKRLIKEMISFTGWNLWGAAAAALFGQGLNILLNLFFGPLVNAARGISVQVQTAVQQFSVNFQTALNPQIIKSYARGDLKAMHTLIYRSSKFTFFLLMCLILPIISEIDIILSIWLKEVPENTNVFVSLILVITLIDAVSNPFMISVAATGKVRVYQSMIGGLLLLILPISYIVLKLGAAPYMVFVVHLGVALVAFIVRLFIIRSLINLSIQGYSKNVLFPCFWVAVPSVLTIWGLKQIVDDSVINVIIIVFVSCIIVLFYSFLLGLTHAERLFIVDRIKNILTNDRGD